MGFCAFGFFKGLGFKGLGLRAKGLGLRVINPESPIPLKKRNRP